MSLSIIIPAYNEALYLPKTLDSVLAIPEFDEIIVVDDGSVDDTREVLEPYRTNPAYSHKLKIIHLEQNKGKGGALQVGFAEAKGDYIAIHDADLEYDPLDIVFMRKIAEKDNTDLVMGSRFLGGKPQRVSYYVNKIGNKLLTGIMNIFFNRTFTDVYCCHKLFKKKLLQGYTITTNGFEVDAEFLCKMLKYHKPRVIEVPTSYYGRTYEEGKKIKWYDFFKVVFQIVRIRLF